LKTPPTIEEGKSEMRVLVADDQAAVRSALRWLLNEEPGISVVGEAIRVEDLLAQAGDIQPDLVLLDWELPGLLAASLSNSASPSTVGQAGCRLLNVLHALHSHPKVIALSGRPDVRQEALDAGADAFVSKGDPPERLLATLRAIDT
jgi:DNA-binding NarL/FixJ family response regulator